MHKVIMSLMVSTFLNFQTKSMSDLALEDRKFFLSSISIGKSLLQAYE